MQRPDHRGLTAINWLGNQTTVAKKRKVNPEFSPFGEWLALSMLIASFISLAIGSTLVH